MSVQPPPEDPFPALLSDPCPPASPSTPPVGGHRHAEDVTRLVEREVREVEALIKEQYPMAAYIELEPHSKLTNRLALADYLESASKESELRAIEEARELLLADMNKLRASRYAEGYELDDGDEAEEHWQDRRQDEPPKGQRG